MIVLLAGACSVAWAVMASDGGARMGDAGSEGSWATVGDLSRPYGRWAAAFVALLVVLTVVGFVRQMARVHRDHMVRFLTNGLTGGVVAIAAAGWMFLPDLMAYGRSGRAPLVALVCVVVVGALLVLALAAASWAWWKQEDPDPSVPVPWVGLALIPVMMSGLVAYAMGLSALLVSGR